MNGITVIIILLVPILFQVFFIQTETMNSGSGDGPVG